MIESFFSPSTDEMRGGINKIIFRITARFWNSLELLGIIRKYKKIALKFLEFLWDYRNYDGILEFLFW
jgi:hypothetical protein